MKQIISEEIKNAIINMTEKENDRTILSLGNCRLDFSKRYIFLGFTKKTIKLGWMNGRELIQVNGSVSKSTFGDLKIHTEGWNYIETLKGVQ